MRYIYGERLRTENIMRPNGGGTALFESATGSTIHQHFKRRALDSADAILNLVWRITFSLATKAICDCSLQPCIWLLPLGAAMSTGFGPAAGEETASPA